MKYLGLRTELVGEDLFLREDGYPEVRIENWREGAIFLPAPIGRRGQAFLFGELLKFRPREGVMFTEVWEGRKSLDELWRRAEEAGEI